MAKQIKRLKIGLIISLFINVFLCVLITLFATFDNKYKNFIFTIKDNEAIIVDYEGEYNKIKIPSKVMYRCKIYPINKLIKPIFTTIPNEIIIPSSIKEVGMIFGNERSLMTSQDKLKINYLGTMKEWCNIIFYKQPFFNYYEGSSLETSVGSHVGDDFVTAVDRQLIINGNKINNVLTEKMLKGITIINSSAFCSYIQLEEIELPSSIKYIGSYAFYFTHLKKITVESEEVWNNIKYEYNSFNDLNKIEIVYKNK